MTVSIGAPAEGSYIVHFLELGEDQMFKYTRVNNTFHILEQIQVSDTGW